MKSFLVNFFYFNKQERNGVFILCGIIALLVAVKLFLPFLLQDTSDIKLIIIEPNTESFFEKNAIIDSTKKDLTIVSKKSSTKFVFNPNIISLEEAISLGFSKKTSKTLLKFREKGGKFYKPSDLKKLYGISEKLFTELEPYILIPNTKTEFKRDTLHNTFALNKPFEKIKKERSILDINTADSLSIVYLKGIGPSFTKRIIKYRTLLGGFHSVFQLKEIYGMTDSLFLNLSSQIQADKNTITKIPINAIDFNSLRKHPYFNFQTAQALINYRFQHGKLSEQDVINLGVFNEEKLNLILPYFVY